MIIPLDQPRADVETVNVKLEARRVGIRYRRQRTGDELVAVDGVDLIVSQGEFVSIVGPSGCGKTTFLNAVDGLIPSRRARCSSTTARSPRPVPIERWCSSSRACCHGERSWGTSSTASRCSTGPAASPRDRETAHRPGRSRRLRRELALRALRRHAAARQPRARAGHRPGAAPPGRALRGAGRADA